MLINNCFCGYIFMNYLLYEFSLCAALALMLFFGGYFLLGKVPDKTIFDNYLRSRQTMGVALLVLSANYLIHFLGGIRFANINAAILMNLSTYFLCYWLFSSALTTLLDRFYLTRKRFTVHLLGWFLFTSLSGFVLLGLAEGVIQQMGLIFMAVWLFVYGFWLARRLILTYRRAVKSFDDTHSDYIAVYVRWMSIFTYWAVIYGVSCGLLTFLPDKYVFLWILSSIPFYIYLFCSYQNYLLFYEQVERVLEMNQDEEGQESVSETSHNIPQFYEGIARNLSKWVEEKAYTQPGFTIEDLARMLNTNRTYLSSYIKNTYHVSFREWITGLRVEYAKQMLREHTDLNVRRISEASGFLSLSYFTKIFAEKEGCSPARWRKKMEEIHQ